MKLNPLGTRPVFETANANVYFCWHKPKVVIVRRISQARHATAYQLTDICHPQALRRPHYCTIVHRPTCIVYTNHCCTFCTGQRCRESAATGEGQGASGGEEAEATIGRILPAVRCDKNQKGKQYCRSKTVVCESRIRSRYAMLKAVIQNKTPEGRNKHYSYRLV